MRIEFFKSVGGQQVLVDTVESDRFINAPTISVMTPTGPNTYAIEQDRTEWIINGSDHFIRVHVKTQ